MNDLFPHFPDRTRIVGTGDLLTDVSCGEKCGPVEPLTESQLTKRILFCPENILSCAKKASREYSKRFVTVIEGV